MTVGRDDAGLAWSEGVLDVLPEGFGFLRSPRYPFANASDDVYVSPSQIRHLHLKPGHVLAGPVRPPKEGEKYFALLHVDTVGGVPIDQRTDRLAFERLTPVLPAQRLRLEHAGCGVGLRMLELLAPLAKGQRVLVLAPPQCGRTRLLVEITAAIVQNHREAHVLALLVDERPEEVTEFLRRTGPSGRCDVVATTFDEAPSRHVEVAELVLHRARRMVEAGRDVVVVLDSLTALVHAYNAALPHSGKILCAGLDASALQGPKRLFGAARSVEEGGSLTVIAALLTDTGAPADDVIAAQLRGKANADVVLDRALAEQHVYPALDVARTGTRREDVILPADELERHLALRRALAALPAERRLDDLLARVRATASNAELLAGLAREG
jgi:transcription termination factor Rho